MNRVSEYRTSTGRVAVRVHFADNKRGLFVDEVSFIPKGKRKPIAILFALSQETGFRKLSVEEKRKVELERLVEVIGSGVYFVLNDALNEAWKSMQPKVIVKGGAMP